MPTTDNSKSTLAPFARKVLPNLSKIHTELRKEEYGENKISGVELGNKIEREKMNGEENPKDKEVFEQVVEKTKTIVAQEEGDPTDQKIRKNFCYKLQKRVVEEE